MRRNMMLLQAFLLLSILLHEDSSVPFACRAEITLRRCDTRDRGAPRFAHLMTQAAALLVHEEHHIPPVAGLRLLDHVSNTPLNGSRAQRRRTWGP